MSRTIVTFASIAFFVLASAGAQADSGGGGGNDRMVEAAAAAKPAARPFNPGPWQARPNGRDFAESSHRHGDHVRSVDRGGDVRDVTRTKRNGKLKRSVSVGGGLPYAELYNPDGSGVRSEGPRGGHNVKAIRRAN